MIYTLKPEQSKELEDVLCFAHGEEFRGLARQYIQCSFSGDFRRPTFLVYESDQTILGAAAISEEFFTINVWGISWVGVIPSAQRRGIGRALVQACLEAISKRIKVPSTALLSVYPEIADFYRKAGFRGATTDHEGGFFLSLPVTPLSR